MIQRRWPDQHDLDLQGHGLRTQRGRGDRAGLLGQVLDPHLASEQRPLERLPGKRLAHHVERVQHEEAAAGTVQCAGADLTEVGLHRAERGAVVDAADEVVVGRIALEHDRRALVVAVIDNDVDAVAAQLLLALHGLRLRDLGRSALLALDRAEVARALGHVTLDVVQQRQYAGLVGPPFAELLQPRTDRGTRHVAGHRTGALAHLLAQAAGLPHGGANELVQLASAVLQLGALLLGEALERRGGQRLTIAHGNADEPRRRLLDLKAALARGTLDLLEDLLLLALDLAERLLAASLELLALERARDLLTCAREQFVEIAPQVAAAPRGQQ